MEIRSEFIIYGGPKFTLEWFVNENGKSQAREYYYKLTQNRRIQFLKLVKRIGDYGKIVNKEKFRNEGDRIYAFKPKPDRFLCFFYIGKRIIVTNAFTKKSQKLPTNEKEKAIQLMRNYKFRVKRGEYYG